MASRRAVLVGWKKPIAGSRRRLPAGGSSGAGWYTARVTPRDEPATYADLAALPDHVVGEIVAGVLYASPRPAPKHANAATDLGAELRARFGRRSDSPDAPGGWIILFEPEVHLEEHAVVPDWIGEILSPSTRRLDRVGKLPVYARHGVGHAWLVDPDARQVEVFRNEDARWVLISTHFDEDVIHAEPFDAIAIELRHLWQEGA